VTKEIQSVWFRCRTLPFTVSEGTSGQPQPDIKITAVEYWGNE
jgi:hypothetical protein